MHSKNTILYGPPGTGKTYDTIRYAVSIIENKPLEEIQKERYEEVLERYKTLKRNNRIVFTTFHQSYGYEEFIEGIKPTLEDEQTEIEYQIQPGIFKEFCEKAQETKFPPRKDVHINSSAQLWKVSLGGSGAIDVINDCFENNRIRIGWDQFGENYLDATNGPEGNTRNVLDSFYNEMQIGDLVFSLKDQKHINGIGVIVGDPEWLDSEDDYIKNSKKKENSITHYKRSREVEWIAKNINENIFELNKRKNLTLKTVYKLKRISVNDAKELLKKYLPNPVQKNEEPYVFIIDEINRGNISKILGELITLIEPSKRIGANEEITVQLPYSKVEFGVPDNVYILGTMNTADRSIALMDTALRRRFQFVEMMPNENILSGKIVDSINLEKMLKVMNRRIEVLYDREHMLGHAYFVSLNSESSLNELSNIFLNSIIPLLQEYFYEDYSKIQMVLGDNTKPEHLKFIRDSSLNTQNLFKGNPEIDLPEKHYVLQQSAFFDKDSYLGIYEE